MRRDEMWRGGEKEVKLSAENARSIFNRCRNSLAASIPINGRLNHATKDRWPRRGATRTRGRRAGEGVGGKINNDAIKLERQPIFQRRELTRSRKLPVALCPSMIQRASVSRYINSPLRYTHGVRKVSLEFQKFITMASEKTNRNIE